jgi:hypothetical protein
VSERIPFAVRAPDDGDTAFIRATWMRTARPLLRGVPDAVFHHDRVGYRRCVEGYLERGTTLVACDPGEPDVIYAWACAEDGVLHCAYTRLPFRKRGLATELVRRLGVYDRAHPVATMEVPRWWQTRNWEIDPFARSIEGHEYRAWCVTEHLQCGEVRVVGVR